MKVFPTLGNIGWMSLMTLLLAGSVGTRLCSAIRPSCRRYGGACIHSTAAPGVLVAIARLGTSALEKGVGSALTHFPHSVNPFLWTQVQGPSDHASFCKVSWVVFGVAADSDSSERRVHGSGGGGSVLMISTTQPAVQRRVHLL